MLEVPTGSGKTQAILAAWMHQRLVQRRAPRRLVYALPMRTLVEQTYDVAVEMRDRLGSEAQGMKIHKLMGGEDLLEDDWRREPAADQILVGTIDLLLSRALNRGYGESRFAWPISFGLLNSDCRWVFDEVQLMGPARTTSAQLDGLRASFGTALPCETMWISATVDREPLRTVDRQELGEVMPLPDADRNGPLKKRLVAAKLLDRADLSDVSPASRPREIATLAAEHHQPASRTIVVLNTVAQAQATFSALSKALGKSGGPRAVLLHSRFRPPDREARMEEVLAPPGGAGTIVIATQVIEAGVDISSRTLLTETAPFAAMVQRLGRCNRAGEESEASVIWLDYGPYEENKRGRKDAAPYAPSDLSRSRQQLRELEGESLSPQRLAGIEVEENREEPATLRRRDLIDLFDTSADVSGMDIDIAPFIREDDQRSLLVCFREVADHAPTYDGMPASEELVQVPRSNLEGRVCWKADYLNQSWEQTRGERVAPGSTLILDAADGGYTPQLGWDGKSKAAVAVIELMKDERRPPSETVETENVGNKPEELFKHLDNVKRAAESLVADLALDGNWSEATVAAAALHDVGKAHPAFQHLLRTAMELDGEASDGKLWAKSGSRGGQRKRRYLRHELASALAVRSSTRSLKLPGDPNLIAYLVAAHHGRVRLSIRPMPGEFQPDATGRKRFALGLVDGDAIPPVKTPIGTVPSMTVDLGCMELGGNGSWTHAAVALRDDPELGPFRLAFLEAVLRTADWRASA